MQRPGMVTDMQAHNQVHIDTRAQRTACDASMIPSNVQQWPCDAACRFDKEGPTNCRGRRWCGLALVRRIAVSGAVSRVGPQLLQAPSPCRQHCLALRLQAIPSRSWLPPLLSVPIGKGGLPTMTMSGHKSAVVKRLQS